MKVKRPLRSKQKPYMTVLKVILVVLTLIYPVFMTMMTGAGIIHNKSSYGEEITGLGVQLIISGAVITAGAVLCLFRKSLPNLIAAVLSAAGCGVCMRALVKLVKHAKDAGWTGFSRYEGVPVSDMYKTRVGPVIAPVLLTILIAAIQYFSYDAYEERRLRKKRRQDKENAPAPSILDD